jgi:hypothetical protein
VDIGILKFRRTNNITELKKQTLRKPVVLLFCPAESPVKATFGGGVFLLGTAGTGESQHQAKGR